MADRDQPRDRARDELLLRCLSLRCAGMSTQRIARVVGVSQATVSHRTNDVRRADEAESGEDLSGVYW